MGKPTGRSDWAKATCGGLLGMIVLVVLFERFIFRDNLDFAGVIAASWRFKDGHTAPRTKGCDVLCFGDSFVQFGVIPRVIRDRTGRRAYNFAVQSGSSASSYFLLRRAIESGARPSLAIADFAQDILADGPASKTRPYPWADLLQPGEMIELSFAAHDPELLARYALGRDSPLLPWPIRGPGQHPRRTRRLRESPATFESPAPEKLESKRGCAGDRKESELP